MIPAEDFTDVTSDDHYDHTLYLSFFLHGQNFGLNFSPHRKCVNRDKTVFRQNSENCKNCFLQENSANGKKAKIYTHIVCSKKKI